MLRIYPVCLAMIREIRPYAERIARFDKDLVCYNFVLAYPAGQLSQGSSAARKNNCTGF